MYISKRYMYIHMVQKSKQHRKFHRGKTLSQSLSQSPPHKQPLKIFFVAFQNSLSLFSFLLSFSLSAPLPPHAPSLPSFLSYFTFCFGCGARFCKITREFPPEFANADILSPAFYTKDACCPSAPSSFFKNWSIIDIQYYMLWVYNMVIYNF